MVWSFVLLAAEQSYAGTSTVQSEQAQNRANLKSKVQAKAVNYTPVKSAKKVIKSAVASKATAAPKASEKKETPSTKIASDAQKLINNFIDSTNKIERSCKSHPNQTKGSSTYPDHREQVDRAYKDYKKMFDYFKLHQNKISKQENDKIKSAVKKLFECKNIKEMVWGGHVDETLNK